MKKIVGILAAVAMATSAFALDISSMIQIDGDVLNYAKDSGLQAIMAKEYDPQGTSDYLWKFNVSGDQAGAEIWNWADGSDHKVKTDKDYVQQYTLWFKPIDALKISVGNVYASSALNPQFGWWAKNAEFTGYGYQFDVAAGPANIRLALAPGQGAYWFAPKIKDATTNTWSDKDDGFTKIANFWFDVTANLDFGTLQFYATKGCAIHPHGFTGWNASDLAFGALFGNCPYMQNGYFIDVAATLANGAVSKDNIGTWNSPAIRDEGLVFEKLVSQIYGQYFINGIGLQLINVVSYTPAGVVQNTTGDWSWIESEAEFKYGFEFKAQYAMGAFTPYIQIDGYSIMDKSMGVKLGCGTSVGGCSIDAGVNLPIAFENYSFNFSVPVQFTVNF